MTTPTPDDLAQALRVLVEDYDHCCGHLTEFNESMDYFEDDIDKTRSLLIAHGQAPAERSKTWEGYSVSMPNLLAWAEESATKMDDSTETH